jgi:hypothetical protein
MKAGDDRRASGSTRKKERVGKFLRSRPTEGFARKRRPKPGSLSLVPILRGDEFGAGGFGKTNRPHYGRLSFSELIGITFSELFGISQLCKRSST